MRLNLFLIFLVFIISIISFVKSESPILKSCSHDSETNMVFLKGIWDGNKGIHILINGKRVKTRLNNWGRNEGDECSDMTIYDVPVNSLGESVSIVYSSGEVSNECIFQSKIAGIALPDTKGGLVTLYGTFYYKNDIKPSILFDDNECSFESGTADEIKCKIESGFGCFSTMSINNIGGYNGNSFRKTNCYKDPMITNVEIDSNEPNKAIVEGFSFWPNAEIILTVDENCNATSNSEGCSFGKELHPKKIELVNDSTFIIEFDQPLSSLSYIDIKYKKFNNPNIDPSLLKETIEHRRYLNN
ncbi:hypothetical protein RB653_008181 [Dictyostelium firmibasis]|uniref:Uncharacterized protein n=1 Tax=Dictyostelium firmibasis TaxID=79012 RepID=A0AAN7YP39_9MYCE